MNFINYFWWIRQVEARILIRWRSCRTSLRLMLRTENESRRCQLISWYVCLRGVLRRYLRSRLFDIMCIIVCSALNSQWSQTSFTLMIFDICFTALLGTCYGICSQSSWRYFRVSEVVVCWTWRSHERYYFAASFTFQIQGCHDDRLFNLLVMFSIRG